MNRQFLENLNTQIQDLKSTGFYKNEREITSAQSSKISIAGGQNVLNFCANNYLGLANHPGIIAAAKKSYDTYGFGLASVRFICGTQTVHHQLEDRISKFLETEATILYPSCFDANGGLFETLFGTEDAIISDELNHASIIDGIRLSKAQRFRYKNNNMEDLEAKLQEAAHCRYKVIATDGVFSMDGIIANLKRITELADSYNTLVMVDDCHAVGFLGENGKGSIEYCDVLGKIDIITGTLGKALGGASGGYTSGRKEIISWLRQRSRPYLFSNTLAPSIAAASIQVLDFIESNHDLRDRLHKNTRYFREHMTKLGFNLIPGEHPIIPVMLGDAKLAQEFATKMLDHNIYVIGFCYPVVPQGKARIRTQMSAAHSQEDLDQAIEAFRIVGKQLNVI
ncbi:2-amino-3-ketobutyrate coenzyme A ligase [Chlamydiales bacterium STE3]|nr:2-amino-3-ketobutyrate coenzyme A ligase [Chlamydiales bacterium STE3]